MHNETAPRTHLFQSETLCETIEQNLFLMGITVVEDKLQNKVPETLADLLRASNRPPDFSAPS